MIKHYFWLIIAMILSSSKMSARDISQGSCFYAIEVALQQPSKGTLLSLSQKGMTMLASLKTLDVSANKLYEILVYLISELLMPEIIITRMIL